MWILKVGKGELLFKDRQTLRFDCSRSRQKQLNGYTIMRKISNKDKLNGRWLVKERVQDRQTGTWGELKGVGRREKVVILSGRCTDVLLCLRTISVNVRVLHMNHSQGMIDYPSTVLAMEVERVHRRQVNFNKEWARLDSTRIKGQYVYSSMIISMRSTLTAID